MHFLAFLLALVVGTTAEPVISGSVASIEFLKQVETATQLSDAGVATPPVSIEVLPRREDGPFEDGPKDVTVKTFLPSATEENDVLK